MNGIVSRITSLLKILREYTLYKNSLYLIASTFFGAGTGFIFWVIAARIYSPEDVGLASAIISGIGLVTTFSLMGLNVGLIRHISEVDTKSELISMCMSIVTLISFVLSFVVLLGMSKITSVLAILESFPIVSVLFILFSVLSSNNAMLSFGVFVGFREAKYTLIQTIFLFIRVFTLPLLIGLGAIGIFISFNITSVISYIVGIYILYKIFNYKIKFSININLLKNIFIYSFGNYLANLLAMLPTYVLPLIVISKLGSEANAYFYVAWMTAYLVIAILENVSTSLFAEGSYNPKEVYEVAKKALKFSFLIATPLVTAMILFGNLILMIFGKQFAQGSLALLRILVLANIFYIFNSIYIAIKRVEKSVAAIICVCGFLSISTLVLSYVLISLVGLVGVGIAWLISNILTAVGIILYNIRYILHH